MKIIGITRIRNEEEIIENTLNHISSFVDEIHVYDDHSTDNTVKICLKHEKVKRVLQAKKWETNPHKRQILEGTQRQEIFLEALKKGPDWIYYFDADEYAYFDDIDFNNKDISAYAMKFFDFYITPEDIDQNYLNRKFMGPEYRDIITLFRPNKNIFFGSRVPNNVGNIKKAGYVKHYGKSISVKQWEDTCDYYINYLFENQPNNSTISEKWRKRKGKAVHAGFSDFKRPLIIWNDRKNTDLVVNNSHGQAE